MLLDEEFAKCRSFYSRIEGRDDAYCSRGSKYQIRGDKIMRNSKLLDDDRITAEEFLNRIIYKQNNLDFGLIDVDIVNIVIDDDSDIEDDECSSQSSSQTTSSSTSHESTKGMCVACTEKQSEMCVIPCFHFCVCVSCWEIILRNATDLRCPGCNGVATDARTMNFV